MSFIFAKRGRQTCAHTLQSLNGRLMEVRTQEEFDRAVNYSKELRSDFWLGGSDREVEGEWRWESNAERIDMNKFWGSGQPWRSGLFGYAESWIRRLSLLHTTTLRL